MDRIQKLIHGVDLSKSTAIEIGALDKPIVPRNSPKVFYVDHADTKALQQKYERDVTVDINSIVNVGGVWGEQTLAQAASSVAPVDLIVASHVIEHVPDLITWLEELGSVLKINGEIRLAIPDKRYCFDILRAETSIYDVLTSHLVKARIPQPRQIFDFALNVVTVDCVDAWSGQLRKDDLVRIFRDQDAFDLAKDVLHNQTYHDIHCWVFTPISFAKLMRDLAKIGKLDLGCSNFIDTEKNTFEFFFYLKKFESHAAIVDSWESVITEFFRTKPDFENNRNKKIEEAAANNSILKSKNEILSLKIIDLESEISSIKSTLSWKITSPLRKIRKFTRRYFPGI